MSLIVVTEFMDERAVQRLRAAHEVVYDPVLVDEAARLHAEAARADALIVRNRTQVRGELLAALGRCRVVGRLGVGLDNIEPRSRLRFSHYDQLIHAAASGQGLAIGRMEMMAPMLREGRLVPVGVNRRPVEGRGFWLLPAPGPMRAEVSAFANWVRRVAGHAASP